MAGQKRRPGSKIQSSRPEKQLARAEIAHVMAAADPAFMQQFREWVEYVYSRGRRLKRNDKELVVTGILCALKAPPSFISEYMQKAIRTGANRHQLIEVAELAGAWGGATVQANGLEAWRLQFAPDLPGVFDPADR